MHTGLRPLLNVPLMTMSLIINFKHLDYRTAKIIAQLCRVKIRCRLEI